MLDSAKSSVPKPGARRQGREMALQLLYLADLVQVLPKEIPIGMELAESILPRAREFSLRLAEGVLSEQKTLDPLIRQFTENWELERMATIDRCLLRLAAYELLHECDTPASVILNEAVEIAKKYSTSESSKFVNGILDKIQHERPTSPS